VVLRLARQQGKTFLARRLLAWRLLQGAAVFGQPQRLINTHPDGPQSVRLLEPVARGFGYQRGGLPGYSKQTFMASWFPGGAESETESAWFARAMTTNALTGNQGITFAYVDELQDAKDQQVTEALGGSLSGARVVQPQRVFTGTGEKPGSELLRKLRRARMRPGMCWLEWSAPPGTPGWDEVGWRWASPDWSDGRAAYLREQLDELGEREFAANFLLSDEALLVDVWLSASLLASCARDVLVVAPLVAAVEVAADQVSWSAAVSDGSQVATLVGGSLPEVVAWLTAFQPPVVLGHQAVCARPELQAVGAELRAVKVHEAAAAAAELGDAVRAGGVVWDHGLAVGEQFGNVVLGQVDGLRRIVESRSRGDVSVVKAMSWALWFSRQHAPETAMVF
jgi:hypothetical protein